METSRVSTDSFGTEETKIYFTSDSDNSAPLVDDDDDKSPLAQTSHRLS
jgi:hypothetical protein